MKLRLSFLLLTVFLFAFVSCNKDDNDDEQLPGTLWFRGYAEKDMIFYVGGELRNASHLDLSTMFDETRRSWISHERYVGDHYFFDGDTLEFRFDDPPYIRRGYFFRNDSLFSMIPHDFLPDTAFPHFTALGSKSELTTKHCLTYTRTYLEDGTSRTGSSFNVSGHETVESVISFSHFQGIDQMGPNDTLLLINQVKVYR